MYSQEVIVMGGPWRSPEPRSVVRLVVPRRDAVIEALQEDSARGVIVWITLTYAAAAAVSLGVLLMLMRS